MASKIYLGLAGNPNSGKTTLFNSLTGSRQQVGNYPGITVDKREGFVNVSDRLLHIVDLPGTYSLTAYSQEELVARNFLVEENPALVINVLNAVNLERNLYLTVQFLELGIPMVLALNMMDEAEKSGMHLDPEMLATFLGVPVVGIVARNDRGRQELLDTVLTEVEETRQTPWRPLEISYGPDLDPVLQDMVAMIRERQFLTERYPPRWTALKFLEEDEEVIRRGRNADPETTDGLDRRCREVAEHCERTLNVHPEAIIADYRYGFINSLLKRGVVERSQAQNRISFSDRVDQVLTHKLLGPLIMLTVLYGMFQVTFGLGEFPLQGLVQLFDWLGEGIRALLPRSMLRSLLVSGIIDGVGGVLSFVPLIMIMFFCLSFLEDSGYMARMAYMLDRLLRGFGLHGCSVMPFIMSGGIPGGCAVPGLMATRSLRSPKEKLATLLTAPFFTCGAKVPVFLLLAGAFFPQSPAQILFWLTLVAWAAALLVARVLRSTIIRGEATPFVMELPPYRLPTLKGLLIHTWEKAWQYIRKAGTLILAVSILIWAAMTFPAPPQDATRDVHQRIQSVRTELEGTQAAQRRGKLQQELQKAQSRLEQVRLRYSLAGRLGRGLEPVSQWAGFDWKTNISLIGGVAAKEVIISTLGTAYSMAEANPEQSRSLSQKLARDPSWNRIKGVGLMVFVLIYSPCFVSVITIVRESSWKWGVFSVVFNTLLAFALSVIIFQAGTRIF
ncbi:MAG: ferrous iron transport protein B [Desulfohalobiaceae bacterium]